MMWTEERVEEMLRLHREGQSTAQIARAWGVTKNCIVGKLYREKVRRGLLASKPRIRKDRSPPRRKSMPTLPVAPIGFMLPFVPVYEPDEGQLASIVHVTGCRWPVRDDEEFIGGVAFCNQATDGRVYCAHHHQKATVKVRASVLPVGLRYGKRAA